MTLQVARASTSSRLIGTDHLTVAGAVYNLSARTLTVRVDPDHFARVPDSVQRQLYRAGTMYESNLNQKGYWGQ